MVIVVNFCVVIVLLVLFLVVVVVMSVDLMVVGFYVGCVECNNVLMLLICGYVIDVFDMNVYFGLWMFVFVVRMFIFGVIMLGFNYWRWEKFCG